MSEQKKKYREEKKKRRISKRIEIEIEIKYQPVKYQNWYTTVTKGLGSDGICIITREYLGVGTIINIQLPLPNLRSILFITGKVLWSDFLFQRKMYESGIRYVVLTKNAKEHLLAYLNIMDNTSADIIIPFGKQ